MIHSIIFLLLFIQEKSSLDESRKKTDEPVPDVEEEASDEELVDTKDNDEVDSKNADDEEENVCVTF